MRDNKREKRKEVFQIITRNRDAFSSLIMRVFSDKPKYRKSFLKKEDKIYDLIGQFPQIMNTLEEESFSIIAEWLQRAEKDLQASIRNFKAKDIELAICDLQQSLEKLAKSYALYFGLYKERDLMRQVSHWPIRIYIKLLENDWLGQAASLFKVKTDPAKGLVFLNKFSRMDHETRKEILKMDKDIPVFLRLHKKITKIISKSISEKDTKKVIKEIKPYKDVENLFRVNFDFASLVMPLSVITCVHESPSRYPDKLREYGIIYKDTELVKNYHKITGFVKENMEKFRLLIKDDKEKGVDWENVNLNELEQQIKAFKKD